MSEYNVCIVGGCGHVGLPLSIVLADQGHKVRIYDINKEAVSLVNSGSLPFLEKGAEEVLRRVVGKTLEATNDRSVISESDYVVIIIGTPVDEHLNPQFTLMLEFFEQLLPYFRNGQHIVLRSTVFPGTTEHIRDFFREHNLDVRVSFCPERIAQGFAIKELIELPQIVSSFDEQGVAEATALFRCLTDDIVVMEPVEAELAKLFTNSWRYIQFAVANQFYMITTSYGVDFYKILNAMKFKYPRAKDFPSSGFAAGPCLFKDTMQVAAFNNNSFFLGHAAMLINEGMPNYIAQRLKDNHTLKDKTVGILGMAFKANNDDKRESLSYKLKKILNVEAKKVLCTDVYIKDSYFVSPEELIESSDIVVVGAPHREYAELKIPDDKTLVDIWNYYGKGGMF